MDCSLQPLVINRLHHLWLLLHRREKLWPYRRRAGTASKGLNRLGIAVVCAWHDVGGEKLRKHKRKVHKENIFSTELEKETSIVWNFSVFIETKEF